MWRSYKIKINHVSSAVVLDIALYSTSVLEHDTICCFFAHQEMMFLPIKTQYPVVEHLVVRHLAQSSSEKAKRSSEVLAEKCRPMLSVPFTYHIIRLTIFKCVVAGACMNCDT